MNDLDRRARYVALRREYGAVNTEALDAANDEADDWNADCRFCLEHLSGTKAQLQSHRCEQYEKTLE